MLGLVCVMLYNTVDQSNAILACAGGEGEGVGGVGGEELNFSPSTQISS